MNTVNVAYLHRPELAMTVDGMHIACDANNRSPARMNIYKIVHTDVITNNSHSDRQEPVDLVASSAITLQSHDLEIASTRYEGTPTIAIAGMQTRAECEVVCSTRACRGVITLTDFNIGKLIHVLNAASESSNTVLSSEHPVLRTEREKFILTDHPIEKLTARQREIFNLLIQGLAVKEIAYQLHLSPKSVDAHKGRIFEKLGIHDRVDLALWAQRHGVGADLSVYDNGNTTAPRSERVLSKTRSMTA